MTDYRTWWQKGFKVHEEFYWRITFPCFWEDEWEHYPEIKEQLWAEREGMT